MTQPASLTATQGLGLEPAHAQAGLSLAMAAAQAGASSHYNEWQGVRGAGPLPAARWQAFFSSLGASGWAGLSASSEQVRQRVQADGASYNVYGAPDNRPWPLKMLPMIIEADEWAVIEHGVLQRARLLEATLADLYGPQQLLRDALLPASLVYAHPHYLRAMHGVAPLGGTRLHMLAFDLARTPQGGFGLLAQRVQAPSGLGYLLKNRLIIGSQFHDQFTALRVQRLAASFRGLLDGLMRCSPAGSRSRIALLTPGPHNETYFEQVFLARYLGVTLVEGSDLTVRSNQLFLKSLHGLERVHILLRRVDDEWLDPLELRADSALGIPGLVQTLRSGELVMANLPGAGVLESPGLHAFWPGVAQRLLGQELLLPAATSWWCGEASVWAQQRARLADFVVAPTFPDSGFNAFVAAELNAGELAALAQRIDADPPAYTLQAHVQPSQTPVWDDGQLQPRAAVMRVFVLANGYGEGGPGEGWLGDGNDAGQGGGWRVLPGAMTRVAGDAPGPGGQAGRGDPWLSMQRGSASIDTWVVARGAVDTTTLLPKPLTAQELQGWRRAVTSRSAENLFWLGRYCERAESSVRLARLMLETLPTAGPGLFRVLDALARRHGLVGARQTSPYGSTAVTPAPAEGAVRPVPPVGPAEPWHGLLRCAQALRERLSPEHWRLIHEAHEHFAQGGTTWAQAAPVDTPQVLAKLAQVAAVLAAITGAQTDHMTRDDGWRLLSVGRQIERLDTLSHALGLGFEHGLHESDEGFALLLGLFDSVITYRAQFQSRREVLPLLQLLVFDTDNPRSLAWVARTLRDRLCKAARHDAAWAQAVAAAAPMPDAWSLEALGGRDTAGRHALLIEALRGCSEGAHRVSDEIGQRLFAHVATADRAVWQ